MYVFLITNRCCHNVFQKDNINTSFQPEMYTSLHNPFSNMDCWSLIFPPDPCKLVSLCDLSACMRVWASFHIFVWPPEIVFLWISYSYPWLIFCCGVHPCFIYLFCKSSLYIIAIYPLISGLPGLPCSPV